MSEVSTASIPNNKIGEPSKFAIYLMNPTVDGDNTPCAMGIYYANKALGMFALLPNDSLVSVLGSGSIPKGSSLQISLATNKEILETKMEQATLASRAGEKHCGCGGKALFGLIREE